MADDDNNINESETINDSNSDDTDSLSDMFSGLELNPFFRYGPYFPRFSSLMPSSFLGIDNDNDHHPKTRCRLVQNKNSRGRRQLNERELKAQREDKIKRTIYVSDIDHNVTEEQLTALFSTYGQVLDCRVCGDPQSRLRFAFVEFADKNSARSALNLCGIMLGFSQIKVLPSKTAIHPVNPTFLPKSEDEKEMCARTVYCTNIDKEVSQDEVKNFFETRCGEVSHIRLSREHGRSRIAFVEFVTAESATMALDCSKQTLGTRLIRVSPSKTHVRGRVARSPPSN